MEELVFDEKFLKIYLNKKSGYLRLVWVGFVSDKNYQSSLDLGLEFIKDHRGLAWIADLKDMKVISRENQNWTNDIWLPKLFKTKLKRMAIINSLSAVNRMCINNIYVKGGSDIPFDIKYFDDSEAAIDWAIGA